MPVEVLVTPGFVKDAKSFAKKYNSFADDLEQLVVDLQANPTMGKSLGANLYKVRLGLESK
ncbi:hypothetical protein Q0590_25345 [Rhodocytophaga aerolata]|uniref:Type II toxin-antitoxin system RelE/ParE family toxin n=1 Tax=Rhodocytophaga aerolata TaxID=455078 RepID=A0ABT8RBZ7_9BACT|nr:hypothetical protein [Rhodocytophaga aerolata]MDO1449628.1 hypothetical protein [Rhodocytophaga aerolata]